MESVYSQAKVTLPDGSMVPLDPGNVYNKIPIDLEIYVLALSYLRPRDISSL